MAERLPGADWSRYYSFDWGNVHFAALDSNAPLTRAEVVAAVLGTGYPGVYAVRVRVPTAADMLESLEIVAGGVRRNRALLPVA